MPVDPALAASAPASAARPPLVPGGPAGDERESLRRLLLAHRDRQRRLLLARAALQGVMALAITALLAAVLLSLGASRALALGLVIGLGLVLFVAALLWPLLPGWRQAGELLVQARRVEALEPELRARLVTAVDRALLPAAPGLPSPPISQALLARAVDLDAEHTLPMAFTLRTSHPLIRRDRDDGSIRWIDDPDAEAIPRRTPLTGWLGKHRVGDDIMHELEGDRFLQAWSVGVASRIDPPFSVEDDEPWVHVGLSEQTLVVYRGHTPVYVTLVSSGLPGHDTPTGVFSIQKKFISDTMANLGEENGGDRYRIEDVPWTQYFEGSVALHGAFWHNGFGLRHSHGCVNLAPADAHRVWNETWPVIPQGWQGVSTDDTGFRASRVVVTE